MNDDKNRNLDSPDAPPPETQEPDPPDTPVWRAVKTGAKWGSLAGFAIAQLIISFQSIQTPFGSIYGGNMLAVFAVWIGIGSTLGAGIGWAGVRSNDSDDSRPPPPDTL